MADPVKYSIVIRRFDFSRDYPGVLHLWEGIERGIHVGPSDMPKEIAKKLLRDPDLFLVAESGDQIIGSVIGGFDGRRGFIYHLAVNASFRLQGAGGRLMSEVEDGLRERGCLRCYLFVTPDNPEGMIYYEKHGWTLMNNLPYVKDLI